MRTQYSNSRRSTTIYYYLLRTFAFEGFHKLLWGQILAQNFQLRVLESPYNPATWKLRLENIRTNESSQNNFFLSCPFLTAWALMIIVYVIIYSQEASSLKYCPSHEFTKLKWGSKWASFRYDLSLNLTLF